jgi:hypothetical protein
MEVIELGIIKNGNEKQQAKHSGPSEITEFGIVTETNDEHS